MRSAVFAFARAVLYFPIVFVLALAERKNKNGIIRKYHAAVRPELVEGQAKGQLEAAAV